MTRTCALRFGTLLLVAVLSNPALAADDQWKPLFDGKTLANWTIKCKPADRARVFWKVEDGTILADSMDPPKHDYIWLASNAEYSDFALKLKFQVYRGNPGNSGVQIRSRYDDQAGWLDGPQIDLNPPGPWRTGMMWDETRGVQRWIYPDLPKGKWVNEAQAAPGLKFYFSDDSPAWNDLEITALGTRIKAVLNGVVITDYDGKGLLDDAAHQQRNVGLKGHIALQIHTGDQLRIRFKDILLKDLAK